jgi:hypothetical protein
MTGPIEPEGAWSCQDRWWKEGSFGNICIRDGLVGRWQAALAALMWQRSADGQGRPFFVLKLNREIEILPIRSGEGASYPV